MQAGKWYNDNIMARMATLLNQAHGLHPPDSHPVFFDPNVFHHIITYFRLRPDHTSQATRLYLNSLQTNGRSGEQHSGDKIDLQSFYDETFEGKMKQKDPRRWFSDRTDPQDAYRVSALLHCRRQLEPDNAIYLGQAGVSCQRRGGLSHHPLARKSKPLDPIRLQPKQQDRVDPGLAR